MNINRPIPQQNIKQVQFTCRFLLQTMYISSCFLTVLLENLIIDINKAVQNLMHNYLTWESNENVKN